MDTNISRVTKLGVFAAILAVFALVGWRLGAPDDFNRMLADAGLAQQTPAPPPPVPETLAAPAQAPAEAPAPAPSQPETPH